MRTAPSPFAWIAGRPYLVVNYDPAPSDLPPLEEILSLLLAHQPANEILVLRPLTQSEAVLLEQSTVERDREAWAQMVVREDDQYRGK